MIDLTRIKNEYFYEYKLNKIRPFDLQKAIERFSYIAFAKLSKSFQGCLYKKIFQVRKIDILPYIIYQN